MRKIVKDGSLRVGKWRYSFRPKGIETKSELELIPMNVAQPKGYVTVIGPKGVFHYELPDGEFDVDYKDLTRIEAEDIHRGIQQAANRYETYSKQDVDIFGKRSYKEGSNIEIFNIYDWKDNLLLNEITGLVVVGISFGFIFVHPEFVFFSFLIVIIIFIWIKLKKTDPETLSDAKAMHLYELDTEYDKAVVDLCLAWQFCFGAGKVWRVKTGKQEPVQGDKLIVPLSTDNALRLGWDDQQHLTLNVAACWGHVGKVRFYWLPDQLLIYRKIEKWPSEDFEHQVIAVPYADLEAEFRPVRGFENRKSRFGPPVRVEHARSGLLRLSSEAGLNLTLACTNADAAQRFHERLLKVKALFMERAARSLA